LSTDHVRTVDPDAGLLTAIAERTMCGGDCPGRIGVDGSYPGCFPGRSHHFYLDASRSGHLDNNQ
jgi:hypothetical protein